MGDLPDGKNGCGAYAVSTDGLVVIGAGRSASGYAAFRWTEATGIVRLGDLPAGRHHFGIYSSDPEKPKNYRRPGKPVLMIEVKEAENTSDFDLGWAYGYRWKLPTKASRSSSGHRRTA